MHLFTVEAEAGDVQLHTPILVFSEGLRPSDSPTRALARRCAGALRSRGSLAVLARTVERASGL